MVVRAQKIIVYLICILAAFVFFGCENVEKPEINGKGELALVVPEGMPAPEYHKPLKDWTARHMDWLNKGFVKLETGEGKEITKSECFTCHYEPDKFCNNCHRFVGVKLVKKEEQKDEQYVNTVNKM